MPVRKPSEAHNDLIAEASDYWDYESATELLAKTARAVHNGDYSSAHRYADLMHGVNQPPLTDVGKAQSMCRDATGSALLGIHLGVPKSISDPTFGRSRKGLDLDWTIDNRVDASFAEWHTRLTDRHTVVFYSLALPSHLALDSRWVDAPPRPGQSRRRYISSATIVDLRTPDLLCFTFRTSPQGALPIRASLSAAAPLQRGEMTETLALYLSKHRRARAHTGQQPVDRMEE